jgi:hypothetical protein
MLFGSLVKVISTKFILVSNWYYELKTNSGLILYNFINMLFMSGAVNHQNVALFLKQPLILCLINSFRVLLDPMYCKYIQDG